MKHKHTTRIAVLAIFIGLTVGNTQSQEQQAGADGGKTEEAFQALIAKCDNTDLLVKRGKVRLILGRIAEDAAAQAQGKIDEGFAKCGEGDMEAANASLDEAFAIADAASTATFGTDAVAEVAEDAAEEETAEADTTSEDADKPWWKFW